MQWDELTEEQQGQVNDWMTQMLRPVVGEFAHLLHKIGVAKIVHGGVVSDILALLDSDVVLPNTSTLSGAVPVAVSELEPILQGLTSLLATYDTPAHWRVYTRLAGGPQVL